MKKLVMIITICMSQLANASDGSSGCGPGWYILKENSLVSSFLRVITNAALFPSTTIGMTVGTSNCSQHKIVETEKESLHYATMNYFEILSEASRGGGKYTDAFATTIGCQKSVRAEFNSELQKHYQDVFFQDRSNPEKLLLNVYKMIFQDEKLLKSCSLQVG